MWAGLFGGLGRGPRNRDCGVPRENPYIRYRVGNLAIRQVDPGDCEAVRDKWLAAGRNNKLEAIRRANGQRPAVCVAADDPSRGLPDYLALGVEEKDRAARRFDLVGETVLQNKRNNGLLPDNLPWRDRYG